MSIFGQSRAQLVAMREAIAEWLRRALPTPEGPAYEPKSTRAPHTDRVSRDGLEIGDKARARFRDRRRAGRVDEASLQATLAAR